MLNIWVGLIFATPKPLDEERLDALRGLARHPYLPRETGLSLAQLPTHALLDVEALETARALGFDWLCMRCVLAFSAVTCIPR